jgi:hypothetical protein
VFQRDVVRFSGIRSAADELLHLFRVARALNGDFGCGGFDLLQVIRRQFDLGCANIFFQPMQLGGAGDWDDPWLLRTVGGSVKRALGAPSTEGEARSEPNQQK